MAEQKRLDRPELREKIAQRAKTLTEEGCWVDKEALEQVFICPNTDCFECFAQNAVLALIPDIDKVESYWKRINQGLMDKAKKDIEEAKKQERERIVKYLEDNITIESGHSLDGIKHHLFKGFIRDSDWQALKK